MPRLFIVNPLSERVSKRGSVLESLSKQTDTNIIQLDPFDALPNAVTQAALDRVDHVFIEGGDGTAQGVLSEFLKQAERFDIFPKFSIVPGGMTNQVAKNIGLKSSKRRHVKAALNTPLIPIELPLLEVVDDDGATYAGFLFSTGAIPQVTRYTTENLHRKGIGGSLAVLGGLLKGIQGNDETLMNITPMSLEGIFDGPHLGTVVTTLPSLILGLDPFWDGNPASAKGSLRTTWVDGNYTHLARNIVGIWLGRKHIDRSSKGFHSGQFETLTYDYGGDIVLDGEFLSIPSGKFTVRETRHVTFLR